jgi:hypothetical protein
MDFHYRLMIEHWKHLPPETNGPEPDDYSRQSESGQQDGDFLGSVLKVQQKGESW